MLLLASELLSESSLRQFAILVGLGYSILCKTS
nr:MAG TPA: hypothetical protein [Bacteriophage sp.]